MPDAITALILSDIHFGSMAEFEQFACHSRVPHGAEKGDIVGALCDAVKKTVKKIDVLIVPGDLSSKGYPHELIGCTKIIDAIRLALDVPADSVVTTFGNHDCNWRVSQLCNDVEDESLQDDDYLELAGLAPGRFVANPKLAADGPYPGSGVFETPAVEAVLLNTGFHSSHKNYPPSGKVGDIQMAWLRDTLSERPYDSAKWRLLILHHHPFNYPYPTAIPDISTLQEGAELLELIGEHSFDIVCHGHRHHPRITTKRETTWKKPVTFFCAGSAAVSASHRNNGQIPNLIHILQLTDRLDNGSAHGTLHSLKYEAGKWWPVSRTPSVPIDPAHCFGSDAVMATLEAEASAVVKALDRIPGSDVSALPARHDLPKHLSLQPMDLIMQLLREAAKAIGAQVLGRYDTDPGLVIVKWPTK